MRNNSARAYNRGMAHLSIRETFPLRLRELRERAGLSRQQLAQATDILPGTVAKLELGLRVPHFGQLESLARALGVPAARLLERPEKKFPPLRRGRPKKAQIPGKSA